MVSSNFMAAGFKAIFSSDSNHTCVYTQMLTPILGRKLIFFHPQTTTVDASRLLQAPLLLDYSQLVALTKAAPLNDGYLTLSVQYSVNTTAASKLSEQLFGNWFVKLQQLQTCGNVTFQFVTFGLLSFYAQTTFTYL